MKWNRLTTRPLTDEEIAEGYRYDFMWDCMTPDINEEVLVSDGKVVWTDNWVECGEGVCFENTEADGLYWMRFPEPPKEEEVDDDR